ncbi:MAG TPA: ThuA domain-containing protein, partial [Solirubrobacter sp.]|nr:ThuA domain-containing protein [Solirubrobacter sp.]
MLLLIGVAVAWLLAVTLAPAAHAQGEGKRILLYTGTTGFRHTDAINNGRPVVQSALENIGFTVDWEDCTNNGGGANNCDNPNKNPRIFTDTNLARYDAILLLNASAGPPGPLWDDAQKAAIIRYVQNGGGIAAVHNATDMGTSAETWNWWDGNSPNSVVGATMRGHAATSLANVAQVQVEDRHHLATRDLPDTYGMGDEHYNFARNVRGSHHVLANLDERTYTPGSNAMGQDHPVTWCKLYDGDNINDNTGTPKSYNDGRTWVTSMGHFGASYTENGGNNNLIKQIVGGVRWVAGDGKKSDCSGTNWSSFTRTVLVSDANGPIGIDVAKDGKVYWSEIGNPVGFNSQGYIKMHDPTGPANNKTTVATIPTRADHGNSEDGVLGFSLQPDFDLDDPNKRHVFVYYSPRPGPGDNWPTSGNQQTVGYNQISRFTLNAAGTEVVPGSERVILRVPKAKISGSPSGFPGGPSDSGPGHVGGAGLDFDSEGNLYLGVGDDVSPNASGHGGYPPLDYRASERWDARKTSANSADLRGKVVRIKPKLDDIPSDATPGVGTTYEIPAGNLFAPGTPNTRPEIYAMGFRQPFTLHTDPKNPGIVGVGEYCHDASSNNATRAPAGTCEWNLIAAPGFFGWPLCVGNNSAANSSFRWNYANQTSTGERYDCSQSSIPSDINWAPDGQTSAPPTFQGLENLPGPAVPATIWKKYTNEQSTADFGDLSAGGMQPIAGPIYRYDPATASQGAFPPYYDGAWFINNRGADNGFWKEVRMRKDNNQFLRVNNWMPYNQAGTTNASWNSLVIGTQFSPSGELYMARFPVTCCRNNTNENQQTQIVKISFNVQDECLTDETAPNTSHQLSGQPYPDEPNTYVNSATLTLTATDVGCAGVDGIEYRINGATDWTPYTEPVHFTGEQVNDYTVEYRAKDRKDNVSAVKTATFKVLKIDDETAPTTNATAEGSKDQRDYFVGSATVTITATDNETGAGVDKIEYRVNGGDWTTYETPIAFNAPGDYSVDYRATDKVQNTSEIKTLSFKILSGAGCTQARSDEFNGPTLGSQWLKHTRNGGTPDSDLSFADGKLTIKTADFEIDAASATTSVGPINFIGQDLNSLGENWEVETQFTVRFNGGWQNASLAVWQADNNFFRTSITHSLNDGSIYTEQSKDNPTTAEGARVQSGGNATILPNSSQPVTIRMRMARVNGANSVTAQYRIIAPESVASPDWVNFGATNATWNNSGGLQLNPTGGPRRDAPGSRIGIMVQSNFPGTPGSFAYQGTPGTVEVDYFRVTPDPVTCETDAPTTTATLDPAAPATGDTYNR